MVGIYQNQGEIDKYLTGAPHADIKPGDIKFADLNKDGVINDNDRTYIGNPNPRLTMALICLQGIKVLIFRYYYRESAEKNITILKRSQIMTPVLLITLSQR